MVAARFSQDRKKAFLWLKAPSDWGKGILMDALADLGLVVYISVKEVERMFDGNPVGKSMQDFKRAFVLFVGALMMFGLVSTPEDIFSVGVGAAR